jgi:hypothetical protein
LDSRSSDDRGLGAELLRDRRLLGVLRSTSAPTKVRIVIDVAAVKEA